MAITGATGIIGSWVTSDVLNAEQRLRILTRRALSTDQENIEIFNGDITKAETLTGFLKGIDTLYHCAGEIHEESRMQEVNVTGTKNLIELALKENPSLRLIHISSAGVIGLPKERIVTEESETAPRNTYEKSKFEAEKIILNSPLASQSVLLRPINVVEKSKPGVAHLFFSRGLKGLIKTFLYGNEMSHMIHSKTVAEAAVFLGNHSSKPHGIYFVSNDHDPKNTYFYIWSGGKDTFFPVLPLFLSTWIRNFSGGNKVSGKTIYSSNKLISLGFKNFCSVKETIRLLDEANPIETLLNAPEQ